MNKQIGYITSAHLLLVAVALGGFCISKIPLNSSGNEQSDQQGLENAKNSAKEIVYSQKAIEGKSLFVSKCGSCHTLFKTAVGPDLTGVVTSEQWADRKQLYKWVRNPAVFMEESDYARGLKRTYGIIMPAFPALSDAEIDAILQYIGEARAAGG